MDYGKSLAILIAEHKTMNILGYGAFSDPALAILFTCLLRLTTRFFISGVGLPCELIIAFVANAQFLFLFLLTGNLITR